MASIKCSNGHTHGSVTEVKQCYGLLTPAAPTPAPTPVVPSWRNKPVSSAQLWKIGQLNGDEVHAAKLTRGEASDYIERLTKKLSSPAPVVAPVPTPEPTQQVRSSKVSDDPRLSMIDRLIGMIPEGRYATAPNGENGHSDFVRIETAKNKRSRYNDSLLVQTQHSDAWEVRMVKWKESGKWSVYRSSTIEVLMEVIADYKTCAMRYGIALQKCMRCGKSLTDDRSRHYLVGPECETKHGYDWPIKLADEQNERTYEQLVALGLPLNQHHQALLRVA